MKLALALLLLLLLQDGAEWRAVLERSKDPSARGDAHFKLGEFAKAVAEYDRMVELDPSIEKSHWRRGIAFFYAGRYDKAAHQFEIYNTFDNVDRENGIWRYFSQYKAHGKEKAREGLLKYAKDDREPFPDVYQLFEGKKAPDEILAKIKAAQISDEDREMRSFYAHLYIGLNFAVEGKPAEAKPHLKKAVDNKWGPKAGFGPNYMWHVGRLHFELLIK
jgi:lipoprotein NlpI